MNLRELFNSTVNKDSSQQFFRVIFETYYEKVFKIIFMITRDQEMSKDMVQETFLKVMTNINQLKDLAKFEAWLFTIATNKAREGLREKIRDKKRNVPVEDVINFPLDQPMCQPSFMLPEQVLEKNELEEKVIEAINQLDDTS